MKYLVYKRKSTAKVAVKTHNDITIARALLKVGASSRLGTIPGGGSVAGPSRRCSQLSLDSAALFDAAAIIVSAYNYYAVTVSLQYVEMADVA